MISVVRPTLSFTGHREHKIDLAVREQLKAKIRELLVKLKPVQVNSGMALGIDSYVAEICIDLGIPFIAAIPFIGQERLWKPHEQDHYKELLTKAAKVVIVSSGEYSVQKMHKRNRWLVDHCDTLVAVYNGSPGGTKNAIDYALKIKRNVEYIKF